MCIRIPLLYGPRRLSIGSAADHHLQGIRIHRVFLITSKAAALRAHWMALNKKNGLSNRSIKKQNVIIINIVLWKHCNVLGYGPDGIIFRWDDIELIVCRLEKEKIKSSEIVSARLHAAALMIEHPFQFIQINQVKICLDNSEIWHKIVPRAEHTSFNLAFVAVSSFFNNTDLTDT